MDEITPKEDGFDIRATSQFADARTLILKHGDTFAVFDRNGDIRPLGLGEQGLYHEGTRHLSRLVLHLGADRPLVLSSTVKEDNALLTVDLTNPDLAFEGALVAQETVHLRRSKFLWQGSCYEQLRIRNYGVTEARLPLTYEFEGDFRDIFEVRGTPRARRGELEEPQLDESEAVLSYMGLDGQRRVTRISCAPRPAVVTGSSLQFDIALDAGQEKTILLFIACENEGGTVAPARATEVQFETALRRARGELEAAEADECQIETSNEQFNAWIHRALSDLRIMVTQMPTGPYVYAGIPWFSTPFGRDGIITALEALWVNPALAAGVLRYLAATQATERDAETDAEPGKILHETRKGEMAALAEIPFRRYYGSVDATPLFIILASAYYDRSRDRPLIEEIWPNIERALAWIEADGDADGDGFVEYARRGRHGLVHQGWKDSHDAVFHADGTLAEPPIALCEAQAYAYAAKRAGARLASLLGRDTRAVELEQSAANLQERFDDAFWCEDLGSYALALDKDKTQCRVRTSNAGHCLFTGIALPQRAQTLAQTLLSTESFSGWGIRTVSSAEPRFNPMAYHNGSVWPHDNALIAQGLSLYGMRAETLALLAAQFDASLSFDLRRLPELFCGFERRPGEGPTPYPAANAPQSWAAAAVFMFLAACLGLSIDAPQSQIRFTRPALPPFLDEVRITNLRVGDAAIDLVLHRYPDDVGIIASNRRGAVEIVAIK